MATVFRVTEVKTYTKKNGVTTFFCNASVVTINDGEDWEYITLRDVDMWIYDRISPDDTVEYYQNHDGTLTCAFTYEQFLESVQQYLAWTRREKG